ncbi:hypothetical protein J4436_02495 [Candidatus Woesearchaeota archaeon]|nr:hypothetical protein [Candidatus Woesearchaeota archaeon]
MDELYRVYYRKETLYIDLEGKIYLKYRIKHPYDSKKDDVMRVDNKMPEKMRQEIRLKGFDEFVNRQELLDLINDFILRKELGIDEIMKKRAEK